MSSRPNTRSFRCCRTPRTAFIPRFSISRSASTLCGASGHSKHRRSREMFDELDPELADAARALVDAAGRARLQPRVTSTLRSHSEQVRLYNRFLAGQGGYPVAPPGYSAHEYGEAFDMVVSPMEALADVGYTWQQWGGGWNPDDAVHFELPGASARARQRGEEQDGSTGILGGAIELGVGSTIATLLRLIPGLSRSQALRLLSSPSQLPSWIIEQITLPSFRR